jgi:hypothetical protein
MKRLLLIVMALVLGSYAPVAVQAPAAARSKMRFAVSFPPTVAKDAIDGRLLVMISSQPGDEPRFQINDNASGQLIFGIDVDGLKPGQDAIVDDSVLGFPIDSIAQIPAGTYTVQALVHKYETFHRGDGKTVKMPMDRGEGQQWNRAPGNLYSTPKQMTIDPARDGIVRVALDRVIPPIEPPKDSKYIRHETIQSEKLTKFWGRPMHLGANVVLP